MEKIIFNMKVSKSQKSRLQKMLAEIKQINRYTYPEIILMSLNLMKTSIKESTNNNIKSNR